MTTTVKRASRGYMLIIACLIVLLALSLFGAFRSIALVGQLDESRASERARSRELQKQIDQFEKCKDAEPGTKGCEEPVADQKPPPVDPKEGPPGEMGPPGPAGSPGPPGRPGKDSTVPGPRGPVGPEGDDSEVPGPSGDPGADGAPGRPGADSSVPGPQGATGEKGATGDKGEKGEPGPAGPAGKDGKDGAPGKDGEPGADGKDATFTVEALDCDAPDGQYVDGLTLTRDEAGDLALTCRYENIRGRGAQ